MTGLVSCGRSVVRGVHRDTRRRMRGSPAEVGPDHRRAIVPLRSKLRGVVHADLDCMQEFADRRDAGAHLALALQGYAERPDVTVVALRRSGIPVGYEIAVRLGLPLVVADDTGHAGVEPAGTELQGRTIIVSVDGVESAPPLIASLTALRRFDPAEIVAAIPVACGDTCAIVATQVDDLVCLVTTPRAVELSYVDFSPSSGREEQRLLQEAGREWRELSLHGSHGW